jgi:hypothetical protein
LPRAAWTAIRLDVIAGVDHRCLVCGSARRLECDEEWSYEDVPDGDNIATLSGLRALCTNCHEAKHTGRAEAHDYLDRALARLSEIRRCSIGDAKKLHSSAIAAWRAQSGKDWMVLVNESLLERYPALAGLHQRRVINDASPSQERAPYYLWAYAQAGTYPAATVRSGKWLLFVDREGVDGAWLKTRAALDAGKLGRCVKVSTARRNPLSTDPHRHVICVYTYDSEDATDMERVLASLRELGFPGQIPYKTDEATHQGRYRVRGDRNIAKRLSREASPRRSIRPKAQ